MRALLLMIRLALRDLRGAPGSLLILVAGIALGVAAVAGGGSVAGTALEGTRAQARQAVGGDLSFRLFHRDFTPDQRAALAEAGTLSVTSELRPRARVADGTGGTLVELKAVDAAWPLVGTAELAPPLPLSEALAPRNGSFGAVADAALFESLGLSLGDRLVLGDLEVTLRARLAAEPDRTFRAFSLGPRVVISREALAETGLAPPGAPVYHYARLRLPADADAAATAAALEARFPEAGWRVVKAADGVPGLERVIAIADALLVLIGLAVLLIGAVGTGGAVRAHLAVRGRRLAVLRALGATPRAAAGVALVQVMLAAALAVTAGLGLGTLGALACRPLLEGLGLAAGAGVVQPGALGGAAAFGMLTALLFALPPLDRMARTQPARLLTGAPSAEAPAPGGSRRLAAALGIGLLAVAGLAVAMTGLPVMTLLFLAAAGLATGLARLGAAGLRRLAGRVRAPRRPVLRLALGALARPGGPTAPVVTALGLTLTVLVCIAALDANARRHLAAALPDQSPGMVLLNVPPAQAEDLVADLAALPGMERARSMPFLHGRLLAVDGVPLAEAPVPRDVAWVARGDRGLSWSATPPPGSTLVAGSWWPSAPQAAPLLSVDARVARRLGVGVGDTLTLSVLGEPVTGTIANLRQVDWSRLDLDFPILLSPLLTPPPHTHVAALWGSAEALSQAETLAAARVPAAAPLRLAPVLERLGAFVTGAGAALTGASALTVLAALVVLAGAVAADHRRRVREAALLTALGARPRQVLAAGLLGHGLLGLATALVAVPLGLVAAWAMLAGLLPGTWETPLLGPGLLAVLAATLLAAVGWSVTRRALKRPPAAVLRAEP